MPENSPIATIAILTWPFLFSGFVGSVIWIWVGPVSVDRSVVPNW